MELSLTIILVLYSLVVFAGYAPTWDYCRCRWWDWEAWRSCSVSCGGGFRLRIRYVSMYTYCQKFEMCASPDMYRDVEKCNQNCYNGGTYTNKCLCANGWNGKCCSNEIRCGDPGSLDNGVVLGSEYTYGKTVNYSCNKHYNLIGGSQIRTCQLSSDWSGIKPRCEYEEQTTKADLSKNRQRRVLKGMPSFLKNATKSRTVMFKLYVETK
ncbi:C4b-binding protein beta chain-like [Saccostrea cucullata]|uniref:C4b-binding protein beta chain-like n=1 Tax=Saccostrea cuccullata TaxID=36930 RepID=UPI002ED0AF05